MYENKTSRDLALRLVLIADMLAISAEPLFTISHNVERNASKSVNSDPMKPTPNRKS